MKWLLTNGCPWDIHTSYAAGECENVDNIKWLIANGCPWDDESFYGIL